MDARAMLCGLLALVAAAPTRADAGEGGLGASPAAAPTHHGDPRRSGAYADPALGPAAVPGLRADPGFSASVPGAIYAQPVLVPAGPGTSRALLVVATEANVVAALDAETGRTAWSVRLGAPVPLGALPCGNIDPLGITGTPVVDLASRTVYAAAMTAGVGGAPRHLVHALALDGGEERPGWPLDVAAALAAQGLAFDPRVQNERGALTLVRGTLYVPYGGHWGDCGDFHGWLVAIPVARPAELSAWRTAARGGGIWAPSGAATDGARVYVSTGNTFGARTWAGGEAVLSFEAGASLAGARPDSFSPSDWRALDDGDVDIGGTGPVLLDLPGSAPEHLAIAFGKDGKAYLLDRTALGGVGRALAVLRVSRRPIIQATAVYTTARGTYAVIRGEGLGCPDGGSGELVAVRVTPGSPPGLQVAWCARQRGRGSPSATVTGAGEAVVWSAGAEGDGKLAAFDGDTGRLLASVAVGGDMRRFQAPLAAGGRVYVAVDAGVKAFRVP